MKKDTRVKAIMLFNFAELDDSQVKMIRNKMCEKYPNHKIFTNPKVFKKYKYVFNWFTCTIEPVIEGFCVLHALPGGRKNVLFMTYDEFCIK